MTAPTGSHSKALLNLFQHDSGSSGSSQVHESKSKALSLIQAASALISEAINGIDGGVLMLITCNYIVITCHC